MTIMRKTDEQLKINQNSQTMFHQKKHTLHKNRLSGISRHTTLSAESVCRAKFKAVTRILAKYGLYHHCMLFLLHSIFHQDLFEIKYILAYSIFPVRGRENHENQLKIFLHYVIKEKNH